MSLWQRGRPTILMMLPSAYQNLLSLVRVSPSPLKYSPTKCVDTVLWLRPRTVAWHQGSFRHDSEGCQQELHNTLGRCAFIPQRVAGVHPFYEWDTEWDLYLLGEPMVCSRCYKNARCAFQDKQDFVWQRLPDIYKLPPISSWGVEVRSRSSSHALICLIVFCRSEKTLTR